MPIWLVAAADAAAAVAVAVVAVAAVEDVQAVEPSPAVAGIAVADQEIISPVADVFVSADTGNLAAAAVAAPDWVVNVEVAAVVVVVAVS